MTTDREQRPLTDQQLVDSRLDEIQTQIEQLIQTAYLMGYNNGLKQS